MGDVTTRQAAWQIVVNQEIKTYVNLLTFVWGSARSRRTSTLKCLLLTISRLTPQSWESRLAMKSYRKVLEGIVRWVCQRNHDLAHAERAVRKTVGLISALLAGKIEGLTLDQKNEGEKVTDRVRSFMFLTFDYES